MYRRLRSTCFPVVALAAILVLCGCPGSPCPEPVIKQISVSKYVTNPTTEAQVTAIGEEATKVMQTNHGGNDMSCCIQFEQQGALTTFDIGDGIIDTQAELTAVFGLPGWVKIVNAINFCGTYNPSTVGCAPLNGTTMAVEILGSNLNGILWDHEYGHNAGLSHSTDADNIMYPTLSSATTHKTQAQCDACLNK